MKKLYLYITVICLCSGYRLNAQCIDSKYYTLCSGQSQILEVVSNWPGSVFTWSLDNVIQAETKNQLTVQRTTLVPLTLNYRCDVKRGNVVYESHNFIVKINPSTPVSIKAEHLCEGELAIFSLGSSHPFNAIKWTIYEGDNVNKKQVFQSETANFISNSLPLNVSLEMVNQYGCVSSADSTFEVNSNPDVKISKKEVSAATDMAEVDCGNTEQQYYITPPTGSAKLMKWSIIYNGETIIDIDTETVGIKIPNDKRFFDYVKIVDEYTLKVKWTKKTNREYTLIIRATTQKGECSFFTDFNTILISDYAPDADTIIHKPYPAKSNVLIFPSGQYRKDLNYRWGYTKPGGIDMVIPGKKFYVEVPNGLKPENQYWVETWYSSNSFCRNRTYAAPIIK